jgi:hypothetical protein
MLYVRRVARSAQPTSVLYREPGEIAGARGYKGITALLRTADPDSLVENTGRTGAFLELVIYTDERPYGKVRATIGAREVAAMAMRQLGSGTRKDSSRDRRRPARRQGNTQASDAYGVPVPDGLHEAIEAERSNLAKAESLLACLTIAMEYGDSDCARGPYYPDVAELARDLVRQSINGLDSLTLQRRLARDRVKEGSRMPPTAESCPAELVYRPYPALPPSLDAR